MALSGVFVTPLAAGALRSLNTSSGDVEADPGRSAPNVVVLNHVSLFVASVSLLATTATFYWFLKMRRSFRQDLIMLLIQSDFMKSLWFVIFPIVHLVHGPIRSDSTFCQISGFFLAVGIEACDVAVLLIALHAAIYIFAPRRPSGQNGLYPYRQLAYAAYIIFPLLMASLAFAGGMPGYENTGEYCYLPVRDPWYRTYLSWLPRYIIFFILVLLNLSMYIYVRVLMERYSRRSSIRTSSARKPPPTPTLECHGLVTPSPTSRRSQDLTGSRRGSQFSEGSGRRQSSVVSFCRIVRSLHAHQPPSRSGQPEVSNPGQYQAPQTSFGWNAWDFPQPTSSTTDRVERDVGPDEITSSTALLQQPAPIYLSTPARNNPASMAARPATHIINGDAPSSSFDSRPVSASQPTSSPPDRIKSGITSPSFPNLVSILRRGPGNGSGTDTRSPPLLSSGVVEVSTGLSKSRERTRRQLRLLFLYPCVYVVTWSIPFVSHVLHYDDSVLGNDPFWFLVLSMVSLAMQGSVDCAVFTVLEKPWRHSRGGFWENLCSRMSFHFTCEPTKGGRTREEMQDDERFARLRRDEEAAQENMHRVERDRLNRESPVTPGGTSRSGRGPKTRGGNNWWDVGIDGVASEDDDIIDCEEETNPS